MGEKPIDRAPCNSDAPLRLGVLVSRSGLMLQALIDACEQAALPASIELVISNRKEAPALDRARAANVTSRVIPHEAFDTSEDFDAAIADALANRDVELICLAGWMPVPSPTFLETFPLLVLTMHSSLLPAFPGANPIRDALDHGARITGCTLPFVTGNLESDPILLQSALRIWPEDDEESLSVRLQVLQQRMFVAGVRLIAEGRVTVQGRHVSIEDGGTEDRTLEWLQAEKPSS